MYINEKEYEEAIGRKGWSSAYIAYLLGINYGTMSRYKRAWIPIPKKLQRMLCEILDVTSDQLFRNEVDHE